MQYPLYGSTMFSVTFRGYWSYGSNTILAINLTGVLLLKPDDKFVICEFPFNDIESILLDPSENFITITVKKGDTEKPRVFVLETPEKSEIGALIASYFPTLANWIREAEAPLRRAKQITNEDRMRLHNQVINCRRALVGILNPLPSQDYIKTQKKTQKKTTKLQKRN